MKKFCVVCGKELGIDKLKYCSYECSINAARKRYKEANPDTFKGKNTATTGAISELRVAVDLLAKGYDVFRALSPSCPCDLAILKDGKLLRIQVRTGAISPSGKLYGVTDKRDDRNSIDVYANALPHKIIYEPLLESFIHNSLEASHNEQEEILKEKVIV